jgi:cell wall-associated NlpC family hydrolase
MQSIDGERQMAEENSLDRRRLLARVGLTGFAIATVALGPGAEAAKNSKRRPDKAKSHRKDKSKQKDKDKTRKKKKQSAHGGASDVVRTAKKYKGTKYKWGGASPKGFDCSGFAWYVYNKAAGIEIGRTVKEQWKHGKSVSRSSWKSGDIVFFEDTFEKGLSHCGIYIGGNKFIHAENEKTGVVISTLDSGYYKDHYAGARRML